MILGVGTDLVRVERFVRIAQYERIQLLRMFTPYELDYAIHEGVFSSAKLALRFAAKEAFFKALSAVSLRSNNPQPKLMTVLRNVGVEHHKTGQPYLAVEWGAFGYTSAPFDVTLSLSDDGAYALAFVIIQEKA